MYLSQFQTAILYITMLALTFVLSQAAKKKNSFLPFALLLMVYVLIAGLRSISVGIDTKNYAKLFETGEYIWLKDKGFIIFTDLFYKKTDVHTYLFVISLLTYTFTFIGIWGIRKHIDLPLTMTFYFACMFLPTLNIVRQSFAFSIVFLALPLLFKNRYVLFILFVVLASTIHIVSFVAILILLFHIICTWSSKRRETKIMIVIFSLIAIAIGIVVFKTSLETKVMNRIIAYFKKITFDFGFFGIAQFTFCLFYSIYVIFHSKEKYSESNTTLSVLTLVSSSGNLLGYVFKYLNRIFTNFGIFQYSAFSLLWKKDENNEIQFDSKPNALFKVVALFLVFYPFISVLVRDGHEVMNYGMFFW